MKKAFTLIELLVVIMLIGILTLAVIVNVGSAQKRSRDAQRKKDLSIVASGIDMFYADKKLYPESSSSFDLLATTLQPLVSGGYLISFPVDPLGNENGYQYKSDGVQYKLISIYPETTISGGNCIDNAVKQVSGDFCDPVNTAYFQISSSSTALTW